MAQFRCALMCLETNNQQNFAPSFPAGGYHRLSSTFTKCLYSAQIIRTMNEDSAWGGDLDVLSDDAERRLLFSVLDSFRQYRRAAHYNSTHIRRQSFYALPSSQWNLLSKPPISFLDTLIKVDDAIDVNADLADAIYEAAVVSLGLEITSSESKQYDWIGWATKTDLDKARSTLHQLYRDWSAEAMPERAACFEPLFDDLYKAFGDFVSEGRMVPKILVPGAGLGRLVFDLSRRGFNVEGNEISYHQLLASSFVLNGTTRPQEWALHPFALTFSNNLNREDQLRKVMIPDVHPGSVPIPGNMSMSAGDFCVVYQGNDYKDFFDAVVTVFFIDTAPNLIKYIETVSNCLKPGGLWINIGPLLWHFDGHDKDLESKEEVSESRGDFENLGVGEAGSFELSQDEVIKLIEYFGFTITKHNTDQIITGYIQNASSMLRNTYMPAYWVARKA